MQKITFIRTNGNVPRPLPGQDHISGVCRVCRQTPCGILRKGAGAALFVYRNGREARHQERRRRAVGTPRAAPPSEPNLQAQPGRNALCRFVRKTRRERRLHLCRGQNSAKLHGRRASAGGRVVRTFGPRRRRSRNAPGRGEQSANLRPSAEHRLRPENHKRLGPALESCGRRQMQRVGDRRTGRQRSGRRTVRG